MNLAGVHSTFGWVVVVANAIAGAWALAAHRYEPARRRELWWATGVAQVAIFVQVGLGVALAQGRENENLQMHMFYGFVAAFAVAIVYSYRAQIKAQRYLLYGFGGLFIAGLCLRAIFLDPA